MSQPVRVAILGCGKMNRSHVKAFVALKEHCTVTCAVDIDIERARQVAELTGAQPATSLEGLWDTFDAIDICTPHHLHAEQSIEALRRGKHVLVEKPMATDRHAAEEMVRVADEAQRVLMVGYVLRYHPLIQTLLHHVHRQTFGRPLLATLSTEDYYVPHSDWLRWVATRGGGVLFSHGCHYIDLLMALFGPIRRATCLRNRLSIQTLEGEETAVALCEFESGVIGTYTASQATRYGRHGLRATVNCEGGRLDLDLAAGELTVHDGQTRVLLRNEAKKPIEEQILHFIDCIRTGTQPLTSGRAALPSLDAIWKMYEADRMNQIARIW